jgi:hypothetical protein
MAPNSKEYYRTWYQNNKEEHLKYLAEKIACEICNCEISRGKKIAHNKTKKHLQNQEKYIKYKELEDKMEKKDELINTIQKSLQSFKELN